MAWTVRNSRHVYRDRWVSLRADDCVTPSGVEISPYYVYEYPDIVHAVVLDRAGHVILVRQYRHGLGEVSLELPGGLMDVEDSDPLAAALRELREETGYEGGRARLLASLSVDPAKMCNRLYLVLVENATATGVPTPDPTEELAIVRVPIAEAVRLALSGGIVSAAHVGLLLTGLQAAGQLTVEPREPV